MSEARGAHAPRARPAAGRTAALTTAATITVLLLFARSGCRS